MEKLITEIYEIIKDYRRHDIDFLYHTEITESHILKWINQFDENDREFVLSELLHILKKSYLTEEKTIEILTLEIETLAKELGYKNVTDFLNETTILDCQEPGKSQKIMLKMVEKILLNKYGYNINKSDKNNIKHWLYIDDVLSSGRTFKDDIIEKINNYGLENFKKDKINIIGAFIILHYWGVKNNWFSLDLYYKFKISNSINFLRVVKVDNYPYINNIHHPNPIFNHVYPIKTEIGEIFLNELENSFERDYNLNNKQHAFRNPDYPLEETFFSTKENRHRFEQIILKKGIEIYNNIGKINTASIRPLGFCPPSYQTLGTGSLYITWRNISNTCPLVFWWDTNGWTPLFPRKH